jgi:hypothetical protein
MHTKCYAAWKGKSNVSCTIGYNQHAALHTGMGSGKSVSLEQLQLCKISTLQGEEHDHTTHGDKQEAG